MSTSSGRQKWNDQSDTGSASTPAARTIRRIFTAGLLIFLLVILMTYWSRESPPATRIATVRAPGYRSIVAAPIPFLKADTELVSGEWDNSPTSLVTAESPTDFEREEQFDQIRSQLERVVQDEDEKLVVYLKAHGVSETDDHGTTQAFILCGESYHPRDAGSGRFPIEELLEAVSGIKASVKLLILDCGHSVSDVRLGMAANEFPKLTAEHVAQLDDPNLWVLLNAGTMQKSRANYDAGNTFFTQGIVDGLAGLADQPAEGGDGNLQVELSEFYAYVLKHGGSESQTPILLRGGQANLQHADSIPADAVIVAGISRQDEGDPEDDTSDNSSSESGDDTDASATEGDGSSADDESTEASVPSATATGGSSKGDAESSSIPDGTGSTQSPTPNGGSAKNETSDENETSGEVATASAEGTEVSTGDGDEPPEMTARPEDASRATASSADEVTPAGNQSENQTPKPLRDTLPAADSRENDSENTAGASLAADLNEAWNVRNQLFAASPIIVGGSAAVTFSALAAVPQRLRLLDDRLLELDTRSRSGGIFSRASLDSGGLVESLREISSQEPTDPPGAGPLRRAIREAWTRAGSDESKQDQLRETTQLWNTLMVTVFRLPSYVSWCDASSQSSISDSRRFEAVEQLIDQVVIIRERVFEFNPDVSSDLSDLETTLLDKRRSVDAVLVKSLNSGSVAEVEAALQTPFLTQKQRRDGVLHLASLTRIDENAAPVMPPQVTTNLLNGSASQFDRALKRLQLHAKLLSLISDAPDLEAMQSFEIEELPTDVAEANAQLRAFGTTIRDQYQSLTGKITQSVAAPQENAEIKGVVPDKSIVRSRMTRFTTAAFLLSCDLDRLESIDPILASALPPIFLPRFAIPTETRIAANIADTPLTLGERVPVEIYLTRTGDNVQLTPAEIRILIEPTDVPVVVRHVSADGQVRQLKNGALLSTVFDSKGKATIKLTLEATDFATPGDSAHRVKVRAELVGPRSPDFTEVVGHLPARDTVALQVRTVDPLPPGIQATPRMLRLFPNRTTRYQLSLVNQTLESRNVRVQLFRVARPADAHWAPGLLFGSDPFLDADTKLFPGVAESLSRTRDTDSPVATSTILTLPKNGQPVNVAFAAAPKAVSKGDATANGTTTSPQSGNSQASSSSREVTNGLVAVVAEMTKNGDTFVTTGKEWTHWIELLPMRPDQIYQCAANWSAKSGTINVEIRPKGQLPPGTDDAPIPLSCQLLTDQTDQSAEVISGIETQTRNYDTFPFRFTRMAATTSDRRILLDVDGYRRAFLMELPCPEQANREAKLVSNRQLLRFESLSAEGSSRLYQSQPASIPGFQVVNKQTGGKPNVVTTMARPVFHGLDTKNIVVGMAIDLPDTFGDRRQSGDAIVVKVEDREFRRFHRDRDLHVSIVGATETGVLSLRTDLTDHVIEFQPNVADGILNFSAELAPEATSSAAMAGRVSAIVDSTPPKIMLNLASSTVQVGDEIRATVDLFDSPSAAPIELVQFGFDQDDDGMLADSELLGKQLHWPEKLVWSQNTQNLEPGRFTLLARAKDAAGNVSRVAISNVTIIPRPTPNPAAKPKLGTVSVRFTRNGKLIVGPKLTFMLGGPPKSTTTGLIEFTDVPLGVPLKLKALGGSIRNRSIKLDEFDVQASPPDDVKVESLELSLKS